MSVVIKNDGKNTLDESIKPNKPLEELTPDEIVEIVKDKGIVGMGGATFPTYVKLKPGKPIDAVLINGSECEPYLTADHRVLLEYADDIVYGLRAMMKAVSAPEGVILIEDNKPDAVALLEEKVKPYDNIRVVAAKTQYPEGAEKMLIKKVMGRAVPSGKLPADVGCVVSNTSTAKAISDAIQKGMPLVERVVSVTGEYIKNPGNYMVKLGTNVQEIIDHCGGVTGEDVVLKMGGPMMGAPIKDTNVPIIKGSNGIIAIAADHTEEKECIKCGRCVDVCPMELQPLEIYKLGQLGDEVLRLLSAEDGAHQHLGIHRGQHRAAAGQRRQRIVKLGFVRSGQGGGSHRRYAAHPFSSINDQLAFRKHPIQLFSCIHFHPFHYNTFLIKCKKNFLSLTDFPWDTDSCQ